DCRILRDTFCGEGRSRARRRISAQRKARAKRAAFAELARYFDAAAVRFDDALRECEPEADTTRASRATLLAAKKRAEHARQIFFRNAHAVVGHDEARALDLLEHAERDLRVRIGRVFVRILE